MKGSGPSIQAAVASRIAAINVPTIAVRKDITPVTSGRSFVRGLRASMARSTMRLKPIARVRAEAIATVIQKNW